MRITIIPEDGYVSVDGVGYTGISMNGVPEDIHAVQWYENVGEIEYVGDVPNATVSNIDTLQPIINRWQAEKDRQDALEADPYYEDTLEQAKERKIANLKILAEARKKNIYEEGANKLDSEATQSISELLNLALIKKVQGDNEWTVSVILKNVDSGTGHQRRISLTADQVLSQIGTLYQDREDVNQLFQNNKDAIEELTTVQAVKDYQIIVE